MRVQKILSQALFSLAVLSLVPSFALSQTTSVDDLLSKLDGVQKQRAELAKQATDLAKEIRDRLKTQGETLAELTGSVPTPVPPPHVNDPLRAKVVAAFAADPGDAVQKKKDAVQLSAFYSAAKDLKPDANSSLAMVGDLIARVRSLGPQLGSDRIPGTRKVIADELTAVLKSPTEPMTAELWRVALETFGRIEAALDEVGK